jgi:catechol 2,3-dioxygenase-like lactoylglutathione lyase family enzyme
MKTNRIDHLVLTVADIDRTVDFYTRILGMEKIEFAQGRIALACGEQKINLHQLGKEFEPRAEHVRAGSADLCLIIDTPIERAIEHIQQHGVDLIAGPVSRSGAKGKIISAYLRDPDGNLLEVSNYI